jgi:hypothetical protein
MGQAGRSFDPLAMISALERNYVDYVLIGGLAQVLRGVDTISTGVDICPSFAKGNLERLNTAINELTTGGHSGPPPAIDEQVLSAAAGVPVVTAAGELKLIAAPAGVPNGYVDLRRAATREDLGHGLRPLVASSGDLAAMAGALGREQDRERLAMLRRIVELEVSGQPLAPRPAPATPRRTRATQRVRRATR